VQADKIKAKLDHACKELLTEHNRRGHLGASQIGGKCVRQAWYAFRWAYQEQHQGRLLRLFNRGHEEEHRFVRWLRAANVEVRDYQTRLMYHDGSDSYLTLDWDAAPSHSEEEEFDQTWAECDDVSHDPIHIKRATDRGEGPRQWGFVDHQGHFAGSSDGKVRADWLPDGWGGAEFKTHNDKSFKMLETKGVLSSKPVHWVQMQIYMHYLGLSWCLYLACNKNDDDLYVEIVYYKPEIAQQYIDRAAKIIDAREAPARYSNDPSWWECKFCAFREICHYDDTPQKNCRSCQYATPGEEGTWVCNKFNQEIPDSFIKIGCNDWFPVK